jgi:aminoglycoside phosphotransferase family enzyme/predicted kinase
MTRRGGPAVFTDWLLANGQGPVEHLQTHISDVLLTPDRAYKFRKPVDLGFLDFCEPRARLQDCLDELRLNRRTAPALYLGLVAVAVRGPAIVVEPLAASDAWARLGDFDDFAVLMRRFAPGMRFDELLGRGRLTDAIADDLADTVAAFHRSAAILREPALADPEHLLRFVRENLTEVARLVGSDAQRAWCARHADWSDAEAARLGDRFRLRVAQGRVRDAHGDLHLQNVCLLDGRATLFDCLEFDARMRCLDVAGDLAFLLMDLQVRGSPRLAWRVLNRYLEATGDWDGLELLRFHVAYRAMVRAKVSLLGPANRPARTSPDPYLDAAARCMVPTPQALVLTHGLSGSGKSALAERLAETVGGIRVRSDIERKRLAQASGPIPAAVGEGAYAPDWTDRTYAALEQAAESILRSGRIAIVDASFLERERRLRFAALADRLGVPFVLLNCRAELPVLEARVEARRARGGDASDADIAVLRAQIASYRPPGGDEPGVTIDCDTTVPLAHWSQPLAWRLLTDRLVPPDGPYPLWC